MFRVLRHVWSVKDNLIIRVYLAQRSTDLGKSIEGLAAIVQETFELNPFSSCLFVFCNRQRDKIKILHWELNGFCLYYRRLEKRNFPWSESSSTSPQVITHRQFR
ncbi:IS66 family insertion sequence element accessory protein TnpB [Bacillus sp. 2205SS5-2]|uniref:IS66 family insertion sequence element accessory protein TnpB n=1 Tax=Bacillus sp. 2205SS5-2 TaxID=3109031 RepID=UPI003FA5BB65